MLIDGIRVRSIYFGLGLTFAFNAYPQDHSKLIEQTPCLFEYRMWYFDTKRSSDPFAVPTDFTREHCDSAAMAHIRIQDEQNQQQAADKARRSEQERINVLEKRKIENIIRTAREEMARRPGVKIGMTADQVIKRTHWGAPLRVHRTTTDGGTREQWVYGDSNYLYFENGRLVTIQN